MHEAFIFPEGELRRGFSTSHKAKLLPRCWRGPPGAGVGPAELPVPVCARGSPQPRWLRASWADLPQQGTLPEGGHCGQQRLRPVFTGSLKDMLLVSVRGAKRPAQSRAASTPRCSRCSWPSQRRRGHLQRPCRAAGLSRGRSKPHEPHLRASGCTVRGAHRRSGQGQAPPRTAR